MNLKSKGVYSGNNLEDIVKDVSYIVSLDENKSIGIHWIASHVITKNTLIVLKLKTL